MIPRPGVPAALAEFDDLPEFGGLFGLDLDEPAPADPVPAEPAFMWFDDDPAAAAAEAAAEDEAVADIAAIEDEAGGVPFADLWQRAFEQAEKRRANSAPAQARCPAPPAEARPGRRASPSRERAGDDDEQALALVRRRGRRAQVAATTTNPT